VKIPVAFEFRFFKQSDVALPPAFRYGPQLASGTSQCSFHQCSTRRHADSVGRVHGLAGCSSCPVLCHGSRANCRRLVVRGTAEATEWIRQSRWRAIGASLKGSPYLKLPDLLRWFSGNIGFHHVHHLLPRVPNYRLQACHEPLQARTDSICVLTLADVLRVPSFALGMRHGIA
jgi:hypothetical protein